MKIPVTYIGCRTAPRELAALLNHEVIATAANDSDAYPRSARQPAEVVSLPKLH
jgi:hypothetical protein